mgnify:CR=1 FL=1
MMRKTQIVIAKSLQEAKGFTLLATIFILIILALAGTYLIKIGAMQQQTVNYTLLTIRAQHAALSALSLAQEKWEQNPQLCPEHAFHFDKQAKALSGYQVNVTCQQKIIYPAVNPTFFALELKAVATKGIFGEREYVSQQISRWLVMDKS